MSDDAKQTVYHTAYTFQLSRTNPLNLGEAQLERQRREMEAWKKKINDPEYASEGEETNNYDNIDYTEFGVNIQILSDNIR